MVTANKILKIIFIVSALILLRILITIPKTNCEACGIEYEGEIINGVEAFQIFEDGCIDYANPWDSQPEINFSIVEDYLK